MLVGPEPRLEPKGWRAHALRTTEPRSARPRPGSRLAVIRCPGWRLSSVLSLQEEVKRPAHEEGDTRKGTAS